MDRNRYRTGQDYEYPARQIKDALKAYKIALCFPDITRFMRDGKPSNRNYK